MQINQNQIKNHKHNWVCERQAGILCRDIWICEVEGCMAKPRGEARHNLW